MKKLYHFCALNQLNNGCIVYTDGTVTSDADLSNYDEYSELKRYIESGMEKLDRPGIVLQSLTVIGEVP